MSTLILSILLLALVYIGWQMNYYREGFATQIVNNSGMVAPAAKPPATKPPPAKPPATKPPATKPPPAKPPAAKPPAAKPSAAKPPAPKAPAPAPIAAVSKQQPIPVSLTVAYNCIPETLNVNNVERSMDAVRAANTLPKPAAPSIRNAPKATTDVSISGCPYSTTTGPALREMPTGACPYNDSYIRKDEIPCWNCTLP